MSDVGDVDSDFERPILILDDVKGVVEVLGRLGVDGEDAVVAKVAADVGLDLACGSVVECISLDSRKM